MRALLGLLCCLTLSVDVGPDAEPNLARAEKVAAVEALLEDISSRRSDGEADGLSESLTRAVDAWTGESAEE